MLLIDAETIRASVSMTQVVDCLADAFRGKSAVPLRQVAQVPGGNADRLFLSMPAFNLNGGGAVKLVTVFPDNSSKALPTVQAVIVSLSDAGTPTAVLDGIAVTHLRTGAASALASRYLSRVDSSQLVIMGTGALAPTMAVAHCTVRPITRISVWGRRMERAIATAAAIRAQVDAGIDILVPDAIDAAVSAADIVSCATSSPTPVLAGQWLSPGVFVDLVGGFSASTREADDDVIRHARIFVDTFDGAFAEAGDLIGPLTRGVINRARVEGELSDLVRGSVAGRVTSEEKIVFKSVGTAIEDLAATRLILAAVAA